MNPTPPPSRKTCPACCEELALKASRCPHCTARQPDAPLMHRDVPGRVAAGVCAALTLQLGWDPAIVRVLFVLAVAASGGAALWAYALLWVLTPFEASGPTPLRRAARWLQGVFSRPETVSEPGPTA